MIQIRREPKKDKNIRVFFDEKTFDQLSRLAVQFDMSLSALIRSIVLDSLSDGESHD